MNIAVPIKFVPDLVEEMEIDSSTGKLDRTFMRLVPNELDEHALEQALILKERHGGTVAVITLDTGDVDEALFTAVAKGADRAIKIAGEGYAEGVTSHAYADLLAEALKNGSYDLILAGTQAVDDLDGSVGALLAAKLGIPYVGYTVKVVAEGGKVVATKEYPGGLLAEIEVNPPAVIGIQAAEKPPRYVVTSLVMDAMKKAKIDEAEGAAAGLEGAAEITGMRPPEAGKGAEMIDGDANAVAEKLVGILKEKGIL
ncbi:MAG: electron transfer flavoprotein subunit beta [Candidatus Eisenbacteria bacterium]|nr:electron transfer flavoprotein subunit beta [Candidatus Eisenbacteria bacterium]